jgi:hypothetical protein
MKKTITFLFLFASLLIYSSVYAQSFTGPSSANTGTTIILTAVGESYSTYSNGNYPTYYYFSNIAGINSSNTQYPSSPVNASQYITVSLSQVTHYFTPSSQTPTSIKVNVTNTYTAPIKVTFNITTQYNYANQSPEGTTGAVNIPYTITIYPTGNSGGTGGSIANYLYRMRNNSSPGKHFYTDSYSEFVNLSNNGWTVETPLGYVYLATYPGATTLYRLYKSQTGEHFYTIDANENSYQLSHGFVSEGNAGFVYSTNVSNSGGPATKPIYRYNSQTNGHFWTSDYSELGSGNSQWTYEGIPFYVLVNPQ